ncbi:uncharacterized protein MKK02DRAFT_40538 [Dioszegia hungarica]|uniref:Uncharacterized protein n=1 Tax=Dioszegia hungarica TaxID=4972 RepID=A0AA38LS60_9TREE|nr:uncharacterized protein MKK02DRAFT_40538 [Dioszegia hungarica]KAI9632234.1 hypothetical protein MKK02DRAFT_40538 [Dioszegia hungarica]
MPHKRAKHSVRVEEHKKKGFNHDPSPSSTRDDTPRSASRILNALTSREKFRERGGRSGEDTGEFRPKKKKQSAAGTTEPVSAFAKEPVLVKGKEKEKATEKGKDKKAEAIPSILPHEKLGDYNRRIEAILRPGVNKAIKTAKSARADAVKAAKEKKGAPAGTGTAAAEEDAAGDGKKRKRSTEEGDYLEPENRPVKVFAPKPAPRRLNDIAQAPPQLPQLRRATKVGAEGQKGASVFTTLGRDPLNAGQKRLLEEERERVVKRYREMKEEREAVAREERKEREKEKTKGKGGKKKGGTVGMGSEKD